MGGLTDRHLALWRLLFDRGSLRVLPAPGGGRPSTVTAATGTLDGRPLVSYVQDSRVAGGAVGALEADTVVAAMRRARAERAPLVGFVESAGARLQDGPAALEGFGRIFFENVALAREVPQVSVVTGTSAGGGCYSPALTDFVVMTRAAEMFLTGPKIVREALGATVTSAQLGGAAVHERNGVCQLVAEDARAAVAAVCDLLRHLVAPVVAPRPPRAGADPGRHVPREPHRVYDVRDVVGDLVDGGHLLELSPRWARSVVTGLARMEGHAVGVVANQPRHLGGALDAAASEKAARFVTTCDRRGVPLLVLVDTPGFLPGERQEAAGIIRHGAELVRAFASARVPRVTVVLRKAYGGAYITMNAKALGARAAIAWHGAEIGIMGARAAVTILRERDAGDYARECIDARNALRIGVVDELVAPSQTRARVCAALIGDGKALMLSQAHN